jgi:hypothetical protein
MVLQIEHMRLPIAFPAEAVPTLVSGLNRMAELAKAPRKPKTH